MVSSFKHEFGVLSWRWYHFTSTLSNMSNGSDFFRVFCWSIQEYLAIPASTILGSQLYMIAPCDLTMNAAWKPYLKSLSLKPRMSQYQCTSQSQFLKKINGLHGASHIASKISPTNFQTLLCEIHLKIHVPLLCEADGVLGVNTPKQLNRMSSVGFLALFMVLEMDHCLGRDVFLGGNICHTCF